MTNNRERFQRGFVIGLYITLLSISAYASYDYRFVKPTRHMGNFESEMSGKFERGLTNTLYGWMEIVWTPTEMINEPVHDTMDPFMIGIPYGIFRTIGRTLIGVYEVATCYAPQKPIMSEIQVES